jgi:hypothetical protein
MTLPTEPSSRQRQDMKGIPPELQAPSKTAIDHPAFRAVADFHCHDPSDIVFCDGLYYMWYSRNVDDHRRITAHYATSPDGIEWTLQGEALPPGPEGEWDESGNLAPYVAVAKGRYYLFYTGFSRGDLSTRHLGCAVADTPDGPWRRFQGNPVLRHSKDSAAWDSDMVGDSNLIYRDGRWWLYFKGKRRLEGASQTRIGVATADAITGPYEKHEDNPLFNGHAFSAWVHRDGVAALCGQYWPEVLWSQDGLNFIETGGAMQNSSTGFYCPENFGDGTNWRGVDWGFDVAVAGGVRYLQQFSCSMLVQE